MLPAKKKFGQNFLHDQNIINKIIQSIEPKPCDHIVEIGPGHGALTIPLLEKATTLNVIEIDKDIIPSLSNKCSDRGNLNIHNKDALKFDFSTLVPPGEKLRIVGNLPYNISTPLLFRLLKYKDKIFDMHFMLQKEVVDRIVAAPNTSSYGRLSVMLQCMCNVSYLFDVSAHCFRPAPKVESAIIQIKPRTHDIIDLGDAMIFEKTVKAAFAQRRKTLRNTLKSILTSNDFNHCNIDPNNRAETLSVEDFARLSRYISNNKPSAESL